RAGRPHDVRAEDVGQRLRVRGRRDVVGRQFADPGHRADDRVELAGEVVEFGVTEFHAGELGEVCHLLAGDRGHPGPSCADWSLWRCHRTTLRSIVVGAWRRTVSDFAHLWITRVSRTRRQRTRYDSR